MPRIIRRRQQRNGGIVTTTAAQLVVLAAVGFLCTFPAFAAHGDDDDHDSTTNALKTTDDDDDHHHHHHHHSNTTPPSTHQQQQHPLLPDHYFEGCCATAAAAAETTVNLTVVQELCWTTADDECSVAAEFHRIELRFKFPVNIDCATAPVERTNDDHAAADDDAAADPLLKQYSNITQINLNGCSVSRHDTLGVEFIPDPGAVQALQLRMFRIAGAVANTTFVRFGALTVLELRDNIIHGIAADSLQRLAALRTLTVCNNNLGSLAGAALADLRQLENLTLHERNLTVAAALRLPAGLRQMSVQVQRFGWLDEWPWSGLERLRIASTELVHSNSGKMPQTLQKMSNLLVLEIIACNLTVWPTFGHDTLRVLNISQNRVRYVDEFRLPRLETLDVSDNLLHDLGDRVLWPLRSLRFLHAQNNRLERIGSDAFSHNTWLESVDLARNRLREIAPNLAMQQPTTIRIDDNPWSCKWALDVAGAQPQLFAHFRYEKVLHNVNMRGLRCQFYDSISLSKFGSESSDSAANFSLDVSAPNGWAENATTTTTPQRRHPKDTAMLTLIILVVGVTFLFLLLFLHIRCRREAMEPFYRSLPYENNAALQQQLQQQQHSMTERTDFVRRALPSSPTTTGDYEEPIQHRRGCNRGRHRKPVAVGTLKRAEAEEDANEESAEQHEDEQPKNGLAESVYEEIPERIDKKPLPESPPAEG